MDIKIEIKEELWMESTSDEMKCISEGTPVSPIINLIKEYGNDIALCRSDTENTQKSALANACLQNNVIVTKECQNNTFACANDFPKNLKIEIKQDSCLEEASVGDPLSVTDAVSSEHVVKFHPNVLECNDGRELITNLGMKDDPIWLEETAVKSETWSKISPLLQNEIQGSTLTKNGIHKEFPSSELRISSEAVTLDRNAVAMSTLYSNAMCEMEDNLKIMQHNCFFKRAKLSEVKGNYVKQVFHERKEEYLTSVEQPNGHKASNCNGQKPCKKEHKCHICEKKFVWKADLKTHILIHEDKKPYKCDICDMGFIRKSSLKEHKMHHEGNRPHSCTMCEKSFSRMANLKRHYSIHENNKPPIISCKLCKKSFTHIIHFKTHKKVHDGKVLYMCEICGRSFPYRFTLNRHYITHEGRKQHKCEICKKSFTHIYHLKRHNKLIHEHKKTIGKEVL